MTTHTVATLDRGFEMTQEGDVTTFSGRGDGLGIGGLIVFSLAVFMGVSILMGMIANSAFMLLVGTPVVTAGLVVMMQRWKRTPWTFTRTPVGIEKNGTMYPFEQIREIQITNGHDPKAVRAAGLMTDGSGRATVSQRMGRARNFKVGFTHGRRTVSLAQHLSHETASSLFRELT